MDRESAGSEMGVGILYQIGSNLIAHRMIKVCTVNHRSVGWIGTDQITSRFCESPREKRCMSDLNRLFLFDFFVFRKVTHFKGSHPRFCESHFAECKQFWRRKTDVLFFSFLCFFGLFHPISCIFFCFVVQCIKMKRFWGGGNRKPWKRKLELSTD